MRIFNWTALVILVMLALGASCLGSFCLANPQPQTINQKLMDAIENADAQRVSQLLQRGADPNFANSRKITPLMLAADFGNTDIALKLVLHGAKVNVADSRGETPLMHALLRPPLGGEWLQTSFFIMSLCLGKGADVNASDANGYTALMDASLWDNLPVARDLIFNGANVNARNKSGDTALLQSARDGLADIVSLLLKSGADRSATDLHGRSALILAITDHEDFNGFIKASHTLSQRPNSPGEKATWKFEQEGIKKDQAGSNKTIALLLRSGFDPNQADENGTTPLMYMAARGNIPAYLVKLAIQKGANTSAKNKNGQTALALAIHQKSQAVVEILQEAGASAP